MIAYGLSPFAPETVAIQASKILLHRIEEYCRRGESFGLETTLSGKSHLKKIADWRRQGYHLILHLLKLASVELAVERVRLRAQHGGHPNPRRRYPQSI